MQWKDRSQVLKSLVDGLSDAELHALGVEALRRWRSAVDDTPHPADKLEAPTRYTFSVHGDFGRALLPLLPRRPQVTTVDLSDNLLKEPFVDGTMAMEWMSGVVEFLWWLERAGLAVTLQAQAIGYPIRMQLTRRGIEFFAAAEDHPLLPGFLERIQTRCPGMSDGVIEMLVDARSCLDVALLRPAVMSIGIAYELAIGDVVEQLVVKGLIDKKARTEEAGLRLKRIRELLTNRIKDLFSDRDEQRAITAAYDFADSLRLSRNKSAHTGSSYYFGETEEFFVSAGRHLPAIWKLGMT